MTMGINTSFELEFDNTITRHPSKIFHYTDVESLFHIVNEKCMFASHIKFLNDWKEFDTGYKILYRNLKRRSETWPLTNIKPNELNFLPEKLPQRSQYSTLTKKPVDIVTQYYLQKILPDVFALSFCTKGDSLYNWITYAKEAGVSIEFDFSQFTFIDFDLRKKKPIMIKHGVRKELFGTICSFSESIPRIIRYVDEGDENIDKIITGFIDSVLREIEKEENRNTIRAVFWGYIIKLFDIIPFIKSQEFINEEEVRVTFRPKIDYFKTNNNQYKEIQNIVNFRMRNNLIIPYLKIGWESVDKLLYPIRSITVGPGKNQLAIFQSVIQFIETQNENIIPTRDNTKEGHLINSGIYQTKNDIKVKLSRIPYIF